MSKKSIFLGIVFLTLIGVGQTVTGSPIDLVLLPNPDITAEFIDVSYNSSTGVFSASGYASKLKYNPAGDWVDIYNNESKTTGGSFNMDAVIASDGTITSGTLAIAGYIEDLFGDSYGTGTLLAGDLINSVGYQGGGGDPLEFQFNVTTSPLAGLYGGVGNNGGVILFLNDSFGGFGGSFASSFNNNMGIPGMGFGTSDTGVEVPEPGTLSLLVLGLVALRKRRRLLS